MARTAALVASLAMLGLLAFLTISVIDRRRGHAAGVVSLLLLAMIGFGVVGRPARPAGGV